MIESWREDSLSGWTTESLIYCCCRKLVCNNTTTKLQSETFPLVKVGWDWEQEQVDQNKEKVKLYSSVGILSVM